MSNIEAIKDQLDQFRADFLNAFNNINFLPLGGFFAGGGRPNNTTLGVPLGTGFSAATFGQVTSAYQDANNTQDPGGRLVQLGFRINW